MAGISVLNPNHTEKHELFGTSFRTVFESNIGSVIGKDMFNQDSSTLRSVWKSDGTLVTAYPIQDKK
jgi:hypothetical protein